MTPTWFAGGSLDRFEVRELAHSLGVTDELALDEAITQMDEDGDNEITQEEFMAWWRVQSANGGSKLFGKMNITIAKIDLVAKSNEAVAKLDDRDVRKVAVQSMQKMFSRMNVSKLKSPRLSSWRFGKKGKKPAAAEEPQAGRRRTSTAIS